MGMKSCPRCNIVIAWNDYSGPDFVHECNSQNSTLDQEDIVKLDAGNTNLQGMSNKLQGTKGEFDVHENTEDYTDRGNKKSTTKTRQHFEYIKLKDESC